MSGNPGTTEVTADALVSGLEADVRARGLRAGDRYLSTRQVGKLFGVNLGLADQAIQKLAEKNLLVRRHRSGTYVGPALAGGPPQVRTVYVLMPESRIRSTAISTGIMLDVLHRTITPPVNVQFSFIPTQQEMAYLKQLIESAQQSGQLAGVLAVSCSREVYRYLSDLRIPLVVLGSPDPDQQDLPFVEEDNFQAGYLLAEYLTRKGHARLALLGAGAGRPGDHHFLDGIAEAMTEARLYPNAMVVRLCPNHLYEFRVQADAVLRQSPRPTGIICRSENIFEVVLDAVRGLGLSVPDDLEVVFQAYYATSRSTSLAYPHVETTQSFEDITVLISKMLQAVREGRSLEQNAVVIPVTMCEPRAESRGSHKDDAPPGSSVRG